MTVKTVYDSAGMIVRVVDLLGDDPVRDAEIENVPVGGFSVEGGHDLDTEYFVAGVATPRPAVTVDPAYEIVADGEDSFWFDVPDETVIATPDGSFDAVGASLVSISSRLAGEFTILVVPPEPYQQSLITLTVVPDDGGLPNLPPTTPDIAILLSQAALTNLTVLAKPKFNVLGWDASTDPEHAYYGLTRYASEADADADTSGVDIEPITEAFYKDADEFVNGVDCWYRVWDVDTNNNRSAKSDPAGEVARGVQTGDIEPAAVKASKKVDGDSSDMVPDPEMADLLSWFATADTGETINVFANAFNASAEGYGQSKYYLYAEASGGTDTRISTPPDIPVIPGAQYDVSGFAGPYSDSALSDTGIGMGVNFYTMDGSGAYTYHSSASLTHGPVPGIIGFPLFHSGLVTVPAGCTRAAIFGASGTATVKIVSFSFRRRSTIYFQEYTPGDFGVFGASSQQTVQSKAVAHGPNAAGVEVTASFRNTTGAGRTFLVEIYAGSTLIADKPDYVLADDGYADIFGVHENPGGTSTTYTLKVTSAGTGNNVANRRLNAKVAK